MTEPVGHLAASTVAVEALVFTVYPLFTLKIDHHFHNQIPSNLQSFNSNPKVETVTSPELNGTEPVDRWSCLRCG